MINLFGVTMSRNVAITLTIITILCCGFPGLASFCTGFIALIGSQSPEIMAGSQSSPQDAIMGGLILFCSGLIFLAVPLIVGFLTLRKPKGDPEIITINEPLPPPS
jgi:hypothetical protein